VAAEAVTTKRSCGATFVAAASAAARPPAPREPRAERGAMFVKRAFARKQTTLGAVDTKYPRA